MLHVAIWPFQVLVLMVPFTIVPQKQPAGIILLSELVTPV